MNLVCVSYNFPPNNDANGLCTARLLAALADLGVDVHVIACDHHRALEAEIESQLVDRRIQITRVPVPRFRRTRSLLGRAQYQLNALHLEWVRAGTWATRQKLRQLSKPMLMTRATPIIANVIGYHCRDLASTWVAHFSDPYPVVKWQHSSQFSWLTRPLHLQWARRMVRNADLVTVTCPNALRYIVGKTGTALKGKSHVVTHLGLPLLARGTFKLERRPGEFWLAHVGNLMSQRNPEILIDGVCRAAQDIPELRFLQYGCLCPEAVRSAPAQMLGSRLILRHIGNLSPRDAYDVQRQVDVNVVVDTDFGLNYSPMILSKYPHAVCSGRPLLMLSLPDSAMGSYTRKYGGGVCVSFREPKEIQMAIVRLHRAWLLNDRSLDPSQQLKWQFSPQTIVVPFLNRLRQHMAARQVSRKEK